MKLYYSAGACSTSCHITLEESGLEYEAIKVDLNQESDPNYALVQQLNPLGTLPILIINGDFRLDQNLSIHTYVADLAPEKNLFPTTADPRRAEAMNWLSFVATDLHKGIGNLFWVSSFSDDPSVQANIRKVILSEVEKLLSYLEQALQTNEFLLGAHFSVIDAYAFVVTGWLHWLHVPLTAYPQIQKYRERVQARPAVTKVLKAEGLI